MEFKSLDDLRSIAEIGIALGERGGWARSAALPASQIQRRRKRLPQQAQTH